MELFTFGTKMPRLLTIELVHQSMTWLNSFPPINGISSTLAPREIMSGVKMDYNKNCQLPLVIMHKFMMILIIQYRNRVWMQFVWVLPIIYKEVIIS